MGYVKNNWVDQEVERPRTYEISNNSDGSVTLIDSFGLVSELGTPVNADNMNHIEEGIEACDLRKYSTTEVFNKYEWATGIINKEKVIYESLKDNNIGNPLTDNTNWKKVSFGGDSGGKYNLGDIIISDHVLEGEEAVGKALQGTYTLTADTAFYTKCLEEYTNPSNTLEAIRNDITTTGNLNIGNGVVSGFSESNYAKTSPLFSLPASITSFEMTAKFTTASTLPNIHCGIFGQLKNISTPRIVFTSKNELEVEMPLNGNTWGPFIKTAYALEPNTTYVAKFTWDGQKIQLYINGVLQGEQVQTECYWSTPDVILGRDDDSTSAFNGLIDLKESYININGARWWTGADVVLKNPNGHYFYDIAAKPIIDNIYQDTGVAYYFGIDTENKRVFLPRTDWFFQMTGNPNEAGKYVPAGLPNIKTADGAYVVFADDTPHQNVPPFKFLSPQGYGAGSQTSNDVGMGFDASLCDPTYGASPTVQPKSTKMLLYFCVGNTLINTANIDTEKLTGDLRNLEANKANIDLSNSTVPHITETYVNGSSWYRIWSDKWCEQGGRYTNRSSGTVVYLKPFANTQYTLGGNCLTYVNDAIFSSEFPHTPTKRGFSYSYSSNREFSWIACGYLA